MMNLEVKVVRQPVLEGEGVVLFSIVRNEEAMLPEFFRHYARLGVSRFVIFDDHSTDATRDILLAQPNCVVLTSEASFGTIVGSRADGKPLRFCNLLRREIPLRYAPDGWALVVDADEFLVLPPEFTSISQLTGHLESVGQHCVTAAMVDFYPRRLADRKQAGGLPPFEASPFFDQGPYFEWSSNQQTPTQYVRGIRARLLRRLYQARPELVRSIAGVDSIPLPALHKTPLVRNGRGVVRTLSSHAIAGPPSAGISAALAHFKFGVELDAKIEDALATAAYDSGSFEYRLLQAIVEDFDDAVLVGPESRRYEGPESLRDAGLMEPVRGG